MITRTTYRRPLPGSPLFFHLPSPAPKQQNKYSAQGRPSPALCKIVVQYRPISALAFFPSSKHCICTFIPVRLPPYTWDEFGYLSHAISVLEARGGTRGFELRNVSGPFRCAPSAGWRHKRVKRILFAAWMYSRLRIHWSPRPRWRLGARKKNGCGAHPKLAT